MSQYQKGRRIARVISAVLGIGSAAAAAALGIAIYPGSTQTVSNVTTEQNGTDQGSAGSGSSSSTATQSPSENSQDGTQNDSSGSSVTSGSGSQNVHGKSSGS